MIICLRRPEAIGQAWSQMDDLSICLLGGTGPQGRGLACRFALAGLTVRIGSRSAGRARDVADELNRRLAGHAGGEGFTPLSGGENGDMVRGSGLIILTVPFKSAPPLLESLGEHWPPGAVLVDVTVPLSFAGGRVRAERPPEGSGSLHLRPLVPEGIAFTGAFKTLPAHLLEQLEAPLDCDTFVYGERAEAKGRLMEVIRRVPGLRPLDVGGLEAAAVVEGMTAMAIRLNRRHKSKMARYRVVGLD